MTLGNASIESKSRATCASRARTHTRDTWIEIKRFEGCEMKYLAIHRVETNPVRDRRTPLSARYRHRNEQECCVTPSHRVSYTLNYYNVERSDGLLSSDRTLSPCISTMLFSLSIAILPLIHYFKYLAMAHPWDFYLPLNIRMNKILIVRSINFFSYRLITFTKRSTCLFHSLSRRQKKTTDDCIAKWLRMGNVKESGGERCRRGEEEKNKKKRWRVIRRNGLSRANIDARCWLDRSAVCFTERRAGGRTLWMDRIEMSGGVNGGLKEIH